MAPPATDLIGSLSRFTLCAVCCFSAARTLQAYRGAAVGFLIHGLALMFGASNFLLNADADMYQSSEIWTATVIGLSLISFTFLWLNGDCFTANMTFSGVLLLAANSGFLSEESKYMAAHSISATAALCILVLSIFTGNSYGITGSLALGSVHMLSSLDSLCFLTKEVASNCVQAAAFLALNHALVHSNSH